jgi:hypothetical protein
MQNQAELLRELKLIKNRLDDLERRPEVPLGLTLIAPPQTLSGSVTSVTFSDISQDYSHLFLFGQARTDAVAEADAPVARLNGDSANNYDRQHLTGSSATPSSGAVRATSSIQVATCEAASSRADNFSPFWVVVFDYTRTDNEKWLLAWSTNFGNVSADADLRVQFFGGRWRSTAAITSLSLLPNTGPNFVSGSRFQLYGVG